MMIKVAVPNRFQLKTVSRFRTVLMPGQGEVHYIGGADILPPPLDAREEGKMIGMLGTEEDGKARSALIEHNLRLVVYIAKKFDNTSVGVEDLISIGTIGLIKAINTFKPDKNIKLATYASRCIEESGAEGIMTAYNRINGTVGGMVRENMEISESVIMKQADQKMYENKKSSR